MTPAIDQVDHGPSTKQQKWIEIRRDPTSMSVRLDRTRHFDRAPSRVLTRAIASSA